MSNYWFLYCHNCSEPGERGPGNWNHGERRLVELLKHLPALAVMPSVDIDRGDLGRFIDFAKEHAEHKVTVRSEYGYDYAECSRRVKCPTCEHTTDYCTLKDAHEGECAPPWAERAALVEEATVNLIAAWLTSDARTLEYAPNVEPIPENIWRTLLEQTAVAIVARKWKP